MLIKYELNEIQTITVGNMFVFIQNYRVLRRTILLKENRKRIRRTKCNPETAGGIVHIFFKNISSEERVIL